MEKRKRMTLTEIDRVPDFGVVRSDSDVDREILFKQANTLRNDMRSIIGVLKAENAELRERIKGLEEALKFQRQALVRVRDIQRCQVGEHDLTMGIQAIDAALAGGKEE